MAASMTMLFSVLIGALLPLIAAQQNSKDPNADFCRRHQHQTCVIDSKLYVDGGLVYYGQSVTETSRPERNTWLLWEDLSSLSAGTPPQYSNLTKSAEVPTVRNGVLWPDQVNKLFYLFGGAYADSEVPDVNSLWSYDTIYNNWTKITPDGTQLAIKWPFLGASDVTDEGDAYYYGGYLSKDSTADWTGDAMMLNSLVKYDTKTNKWDNKTWQGPPRAEGNLHYIPASQRGMLVHFGGLEQTAPGNTSYVSMSDIHIFDIANSRSFTQTATGEVPQRRRGFCSGVVWAEDYSSYNFYVYGGISPNETALGDLHILTLPSFQWISWFPTPQKDYFAGGKAWSSCNVIQNAKMLIMGGELINPDRTDCDAHTAFGQHGMLLGQESIELGNMWYGLQPDIPTYRVPGNITAIIGGGTDGKATVTAPAAGWQVSDLSVYFKASYPAVSRAATRPLPNQSSTATNEPEQPASKTNTGAIAGGVVGGVVALAGIIALAWFCLLRRRSQKQEEQSFAHGPTAAATQQSDLAPIQTDKYVATPTTTSYPSPFPSPHPQGPGYSPQASPPPPAWSEHHTPSSYYQGSPPMSQHEWTDWDQQRGYSAHDMPIHFATQQQYYPPPSEQAQFPSKQAHMASVEAPANEILEMPEIRSPAPKRPV